MSQLMKKRFPSITSIQDLGSDGNTSFLRAARNGQLDKVLEHLKSNIDINTSNANGLNALHLASKDGHVEIVEELLKRGAVVDAATKKGNTALHIASLAGQEEVVKLLVQHGASVNVQSQNGFTPLYMAAQENHDNVVKYLLSNGANQSLSTEDGFTPLAVAMQQGHDKVVTVLLENDTRGKVRLPALHIAAKKDDVKAAKLLLENEHNPDVTSKSGFTPLHIASHYGNQQIANLLIQKGADVNYSAKHNITPLHVAAKWGKTNMVATLVDNGATIESKTRDGLTPLHCAARSGHEQVVDMLLERGAPISSKTKNGLAPLHMAAQGDHVDAARILLYHRAPVDEVTVDYLTALHVAAHCGHVRVAKLLLDRQADANARALNGFTPLHIACKKNRIKVVELLLKHGASIGATTESGLTPLHVASFMGCMNIVIYLLQHDASPDVPTVRGETPLHLAARANQTDIIRILLRNGAQVDARAREQQTPLHIASRLGNVDIVMLLLQHGAKVDNTTKDMYSALHIAAKEGQDEVAAVLIENGATLDATTKKGFTPLHLAAKYGHLKVAKLLLQKEAPVDAQGKNGVTPLHVASHYDHQNVALLLLDKGASPHATAKNGHTPLHTAARKNQMDIANTLLEYGAQPNAESKAGFTPLHLSSQEGHTDMTSLLLEHKADANHQAKNGLTPLHLCAQEDRVPAAEILVKNGAVVDTPTKAGYTPLHVACHFGQVNMVRYLLANGAKVDASTSLGYTPLHQAAQQGHTNIVNLLLENNADPNAVTNNGQTPLNIANKLGYITVIETLKVVTTTTSIITNTTTNIEEKYRVVAPEAMHETFMSDSEEEGGEDTLLGDQTYRYLTADEMKSLGDDSLPIDVTRDERIDSNRMVISGDSNMLPPQNIEDNISPEHVTQNYVEYIKKYQPDNVDIGRHPINIGFLVSFLVDARGGAMRGCRHSGVRVIVPPRCAPSPTRITCRYVRPQRTPHPPPLMEGEALASRVLELGPVGAKFLGPVIIEVPHFAALRGKEREIVILRSDNGENWKEHTVEATEEVVNEVLNESFEAEDLSQLEDMASGRITRILTQDFPQYFAVVSRVRQEVHAIGPEGGMVSSTVVPQVQAVFPEGALTKKIKVGLQAQPIDPELTAKLLGHGVAVSPVVTVEPRRRKFHKAITLSMPAPRAHSQGMINQYSGSAPTLRLLCSITGGTTRAQWEDVTGSTPLTFVNDCVSFTTTVSARFWLMDCRNIGDATKMATELYKEAIHVPFMAKFVVFAKRIDPLEARLRVFCMTDDKEDKTLEQQEHFTEVAKSRDVEVLEGKPQYIEFAGNLVPITKSGEQLQFSFRAFRENRLPFSVRVKDQHAEAVSRCLFMKEPKVPKGEPPQQPICILNIVLPDDIVSETISLSDTDSVKRHILLSENFDYYRPDPRLADMSNLLGEDWVPLATQLGLTPSEINVIKSEYPDSVAKQGQSMLRMWLSQSGNKAQTNILENALRRIEREDIIPQCLNVDQNGQTITRIKHEEKQIYRLKRDSSLDRDRKVTDKELIPETRETYQVHDKYSAEEKAVAISDEEEDFNKTVTERRQQIENKLSADRTIPASSQRVEIVQEITSIKRQSIVEDKIAEVQKGDIKPSELAKPTTTTITKTTEVILPAEDVSKTTEKIAKTTQSTAVSETIDKSGTHETETTILDTRTTQPHEDTHRTAEDSELLKEVTERFGGKKPMPKLLADEDPKSPHFSKTPPPSPAEFLITQQAATVQAWDADKKPTELQSSKGPLEQDAALQGISTTRTKYLASNEDVGFVENVGQTFNGLPTHLNNSNFKSVCDQTNALIQSESLAEPFDTNTVTYDKTEEVEKQDSNKMESSKEDKKQKKGIFETFKTFVSKSFDTDSDTEKSPKKDKKEKKHKKKKTKDTVPQDLPKPKLSSPSIEKKDFADIPYIETSDVSPPKTPDSVTKKIVSESKVLKPKSPKSPKSTKITVVEEVTKVFQPVSIEEEEFSITIDPTRSEVPKKSRETFTLNIDESINKLEKEILDKSPILPEEKIIKPVVNIDAPVPPPRKLKHIYEDIDEPIISIPPDNIIETVEEPMNHLDNEIKKDTKINLVMNDTSGFLQQEISNYHDVKPITSDYKEKSQQINVDIPKSTAEKLRKEKKLKREKSKSLERDIKSEKKGFLSGLFTKKSTDNEQTKPMFSKESIDSMNNTNSFLMNEVSNYQDVKSIKQTVGEVLNKTDEERKLEPETIGKSEKQEEPNISQSISDDITVVKKGTLGFLEQEVSNYHDVKPIITEKVEESVPKKTIIHETIVVKDVESPLKVEKMKKEEKTQSQEKDDKSDKKGFLSNLFGKKQVEDDTKEDKSTVSKSIDEIMKDSNSFLEQEVSNYHDVKPIITEMVEESVPKKTVIHETIVVKDVESPLKIEKTTKVEKSKDQEKDDKTEKKGFLSNLFGKKQVEDETKGEISKSIDEITKDSSTFLETEITKYHDVKPIIKETPFEENLTSGEKVAAVEATKKDKSLEREIKSKESSQSPVKKRILPGFLSKKDKKEADSSVTENVSQDIIVDMKDTLGFLEQEVSNYHDVKPIISEKVEESTSNKSVLHETIVIKDVKSSPVISAKVEETDFKESFIDKTALVKDDPQPKTEDTPGKSKNQERSLEQDIKSEKKGFLSGLFGKKYSVDESEYKPVISKEIVDTMRDTSNFLEQEVSKYHDVKPFSEQLSSVPKLEEGTVCATILVKDETPLKRDKKLKREKSKSLERDVKPERKGFLSGLFGKKPTSVDEKYQMPEELLTTINDTNNFLEGEISNYHDVKMINQKATEIDLKPKTETPIVETYKEENIERSETSLLESTGKREIGDLTLKSDIILDKNTVSQQSDVIPETVIIKEETIKLIDKKTKQAKSKSLERDVKSDKGFLSGLLRKKTVDSEPSEAEPSISKETIEIMNKTNAFLETEVSNYHDVKGINIQEIDTSEQTKTLIQKSFIVKEEISLKKDKKSKQEKSKSLERDVKIEKKSFLGGLFSKKTHDDETIDDKSQPSKDLIQSMNDSNSVKELKTHIEAVPVQEISNEIKSESEEIICKPVRSINISELPSQEISLLKKDTSNFLEQEICNYYDVRPITSEISQESNLKESSQESTELPTRKVKILKREKSKSSERDVKSDKKGFLTGIFGKKVSEDSVENKSKIISEQPTEENNTDTEKSSTFLEQDVIKYHDVKPIKTEVTLETDKKEKIIQEKILKVKEEIPPSKEAQFKREKSKSLERENKSEKKKFLSGIFNKKSSDDKYVGDKPQISQETIETMKGTNEFLEQEISKYHDVKPLVTSLSKTKDEDSNIGAVGMVDGSVDVEAEKNKLKDSDKDKTIDKKKTKRNSTDNSGFLGSLFGRKNSDKRSKKDIKLPTKQFSEETKNIDDSTLFLSQEINNYYDNRTPIQSQDIEKESPLHEKLKTKVKFENLENKGRGIKSPVKNLENIILKDISELERSVEEQVTTVRREVSKMFDDDGNVCKVTVVQTVDTHGTSKDDPYLQSDSHKFITELKSYEDEKAEQITDLDIDEYLLGDNKDSDKITYEKSSSRDGTDIKYKLKLIEASNTVDEIIELASKKASDHHASLKDVKPEHVDIEEPLISDTNLVNELIESFEEKLTEINDVCRTLPGKTLVETSSTTYSIGNDNKSNTEVKKMPVVEITELPLSRKQNIQSEITTFIENEMRESSTEPHIDVEKTVEKLPADIVVKGKSQVKEEPETITKTSKGILNKIGDKLSGKHKKGKYVVPTSVHSGKSNETYIPSSVENEQIVTEVSQKEIKEFKEKSEKEAKGFFEKIGVKIGGKGKKRTDSCESESLENENVAKTVSDKKGSKQLSNIEDVKLSDIERNVKEVLKTGTEATVSKIDKELESAEQTSDNIRKGITNISSSVEKEIVNTENIIKDDINKMVDVVEDFKTTGVKETNVLLGQLTEKVQDLNKDLSSGEQFISEKVGSITDPSHSLGDRNTKITVTEIRGVVHDGAFETTSKVITEYSTEGMNSESVKVVKTNVETICKEQKKDKALEFEDNIERHNIKGTSDKFLDNFSEVLNNEQSPFSGMTRAVSDNLGKINVNTGSTKYISEANIDLSNLTSNVDYSEAPSQRIIRQQASNAFPNVLDFSDKIGSFQVSVTEPIENTEVKIKKTLFHLESEDDDSEISNKQILNRQDSAKSNVLESLTESNLDSLINNLTQSLKDTTEKKCSEQALTSQVSDSQKEVDIIEQKIRDLDKALDSLEQIDIQLKPDAPTEDVTLEKKLRRVERKFERMASEALEKESTDAKQKQLTTPEAEAIREKEYQKLVSQMSTEEVSDFQREFSHLLDDTTFSKTEDGETKSPDSQADVLDLPQGEEAAASQPSATDKAESEERQGGSQEHRVADQHQLSEEMKALLKELEKESKQ